MTDLAEALTSGIEVNVDEQIALRAVDDLNEVDQTGEPPQSERFVVDDRSKAQWALRKLAHAHKEIAANDEQATAERESIDAWLQDANKPWEREAEFFEALLVEFARAELSEERKTLKLPNGTLMRRAGRAHADIEDPDAFIKWANKDRPEFVRIKTEIDKTAVNTAAIKDGEKLPGVIVSAGEVAYKVEAS